MPEETSFDFSTALTQLKAGLRVADTNWGTGEWLEVKGQQDCAAVTQPFIVKYNHGKYSAWSPDSLALWAEYIVLK